MAHGDDDGLRVPPRLAPIQVVVLAVRDEGDVVARCRALTDELRAAGRPRPARRPRRRARSGAGPPTGSSRVCPSGSRSGPATSPTAWPRSCGASSRRRGAQGRGAARRRRRRGRRRARAPAGGAARRGHRAARRAHRRRRRRSTTPATPPPTGWARIPWDDGRRRGRGRARAGAASPCAASSAPTAPCPTSDDEPDLVALVARAVLRPSRVPDRAPPVSPMLAKLARELPPAAASRRLPLRAQVGRLPRHRVPRRRRRRDRQPQREAADPLLPRSHRPVARPASPSAASSTARS